MSKDIRNFFGAKAFAKPAVKPVAKASKAVSKSATVAKKRKKRNVIEDDDDYDDDDDDVKEITPEEPKITTSKYFSSKKTEKKPEVEISASDFFGKSKIKATKPNIRKRDSLVEENEPPKDSKNSSKSQKTPKKEVPDHDTRATTVATSKNKKADAEGEEKKAARSPKKEVKSPKKNVKKEVIEIEEAKEAEKKIATPKTKKQASPAKKIVKAEDDGKAKSLSSLKYTPKGKAASESQKTEIKKEPSTLKPRSTSTSSTPKRSTSSSSSSSSSSTPKAHSSSSSSSSSLSSSSQKATPKVEKKVKAEEVEPSQSTSIKEEPAEVKKKGGYRNFMSRDGPRNLGERDLPEGEPNCCLGLTFVFTGELDSVARDDAIDLVKKLAGKVTSAVSGKTNYLVVGRQPGESKTKKAEKLNTKILTEDEFLDFIPTLSAKSDPTATASASFSASSSSKRPSKSDSFAAKRAKSSSSASTSPTPTVSSSSSSSSSKLTTADEDGMLWVDKYKPKTVKDLIGNKTAHDRILSWLQKFDASGKQSEPPGKNKILNPKTRAIIISGPPGIGKSSAAAILAKHAGYVIKEFNASDTRSKKSLSMTVQVLTQSQNIGGAFLNTKTDDQGSKHVLIMDEVDGMSAGDRGGVAELIKILKHTRIPIICICNDHNSTKIRSLINHCHDIRFARPTAQAIKGRLMGIAFKEGIKIDAPTLEQIITSKNSDIRQILNQLSLWQTQKKQLSYDGVKQDLKRSLKDTVISPFDGVKNIYSERENMKMSVDEKLRVFFSDDLVPLMSQENYLNFRPSIKTNNLSKQQQDLQILETVSMAADSFSDADFVSSKIMTNQAWNLMPAHGILALARPATLMRGNYAGSGWGLSFPSWLGNYSKCKKTDRLLGEIQLHLRVKCGTEKMQINQYYLNLLKHKLVDPLIEKKSDGIADVIEFMDEYNLTREDWDSIIELSTFPGMGPSIVTKVDTKVKSAFTRTYNKQAHMLPFALLDKKAPKRSGGAAPAVQRNEDGEVIDDDVKLEEDDEKNGNEEDDDVSSDKMIKAKTKAKTTPKAKGAASKAGKKPAIKRAASTSKKPAKRRK